MSDLKLSIRINADGSAAVTGIQRVNRALGTTHDAAGKAAKGMDGLGSALGSLKGVLAGVGLAALGAEFIRVNAEVGKFRAQLNTVTGSVTQASAAWDNLNKFAAQTPFTLDQAVKAFITLKARGLDASMESMRAYADLASAMGTDVNNMAMAVADAATGQFERILEFGIDAASMGNQVAFTFKGVTDTVSKNADAIESYLLRISQTNYAGAAAKEMDTLGGSISNLSDSAYRFWTALGDTGAAQGVADLIKGMAGGFDSLTESIKSASTEQSGFWRTLNDEWEKAKKNDLKPFWEWNKKQWREGMTAVHGPEQMGAAYGSQGRAIADTQGKIDAAKERLASSQKLDFDQSGRELIVGATAKGQRIREEIAGYERELELLKEIAAEERAMGRSTPAAAATSTDPGAKQTLSERILAIGRGAPGINTRSAPDISKGIARAGPNAAAIVADAAKAAGIPVDLLYAVWGLEGSFTTNTRLTNSIGAFGAFQMIPPTAKRYGVTKDSDLYHQAFGSASYLSDILKAPLVGGDVTRALFGYHGGENSDRKWGPDTRAYALAGIQSLQAYGGDTGKVDLDKLGQQEQETYQKRLEQTRKFNEDTAALRAAAQGEIAKVENDFDQRILKAKEDRYADAKAIEANVAALEVAKATEIAKVRADLAKNEAEAAKEARGALADKLQTGKDAQSIYDSLTQPQRDFIDRLKAEGSQAGLTAVQVAKLSAEMELNRQIADAFAKQKDLAWDAAQEARRTNTPVDMSKADQAGEAAAYLQRQKDEVLGIAEATAKAKETTKETLPTIEEMWAETVKNVSKGIQGDLSTAFEGLFNGTLKSADDFMDALKKTIVGGLAKLAAAVLMQPINILINTALSGGVGGSTSAGGSVASGIGSLFGGGSGPAGGSLLSSLGSLFAGNSIGSSIAGGVYSMFSPTSGGSLTMAGQLGTAAYSLPNWAFGAAGIGGGVLGSMMYPNSPYSSIGGSLGGTAGLIGGTALGGYLGAGGGMMAGAMAGSVVPVIGTIIGAVIGAIAGGALGGGKDTTPEKEAILKMQAEYKTGLDVEKQNAQSGIAAQMQAEESARTAAIAAEYDRILKIMQERRKLESELTGLVFGEKRAREDQLNELNASNRGIKKMAFAFSDLKDVATQLQGQWQSLATSIKDWAKNARLNLAAPGENAARDAYLTQLSAARAGDLESIGGLTGYADRYLAEIKTSSASYAEYQRRAQAVIADVAGVGAQAQSAADKLADITGQTNKTLQQQYALALKSAAEALEYYRSSGVYDQAVLDQLTRLNLGSRSTTGFAEGGISTGPASGYDVTLHGREAVIPLKGGAVPVAISWEGMIAELRTLSAEIQTLRHEQQRQHHASFTEQRETADTLRRWEAIGQPGVRTT